VGSKQWAAGNRLRFYHDSILTTGRSLLLPAYCLLAFPGTPQKRDLARTQHNLRDVIGYGKGLLKSKL